MYRFEFYKTVYVGTITDDTVLIDHMKTAFFIDNLTYNK